MAKTKDYKAIAKKKITKPSKGSRRPNFHIYSGHKKGKTHLGLTAPNVLVLDPEHGTDPFKKRDPDVWHIDRWQDTDEVYNYLRLGDHPYDWVLCDGMTKMSNYALRYIMGIREDRSLEAKPGIVDRRDYLKSGELMKEFLTKLHNLPQGIIYTSHERMIEIETDDEEDEDAEVAAAMFVPDLPKGVRGSVNALVDLIGRLYVVNIERSDGTTRKQRRLWIGESVKYDTGYRSDYGPLPDMVKVPTIPKLVRLLETGSTRAE